MGEHSEQVCMVSGCDCQWDQPTHLCTEHRSLIEGKRPPGVLYDQLPVTKKIELSNGGNPCRLCLPCKQSGQICPRCGDCDHCSPPYTKPKCTYCYDGARSPEADGSCPVCGGAGYAY